MRLVMEVHYTDGFTYDCTTTYQLEAPSAEEALCELEKLAMDFKYNFGAEIDFYGWKFNPSDFIEQAGTKRVFIAPDIYTVDEWFARKYPMMD